MANGSAAVLERWMQILGTLEKGTAAEKNVFQFDTSQLKKWGPQGAVAPISELMDIVLEGFKSESSYSAFKTPEWQAAKKAFVRFAYSLGVHNLRPASYRAVIDDMRARDTLESNSGWPEFKRRSLPGVKSKAIADAESGAYKEYPAIALFRNYNQKTRLVWMFPMSTNLVEASYYQPLMSAFQARSDSFFSPWKGFDAVRRQISEAYSSGIFLSASDFSSTDAHFQWEATEQVADVLAPLFQEQYRDGLRESLHHMHNIPLVIGESQMVTGPHGVASGSNWTNFVETIFDRLFGWYVWSKSCVKYHRPAVDALYAIGDDMTWWSETYFPQFSTDLEQWGKDVGQVIKAEKTTNDRDKVKSLQRLFQRGYNREDGEVRGVYSTVRALNSSLHPERFHPKNKGWSSDMFCARQFMILENCVDHPLFREFVEFICAGNEHLIPFARQTDKDLDRITRKSKLVPGLNPTYNQERRDSSLAAFESIRIAREL
nr:MAG: RNA-dependent RNA polymerase [Porcine picobirnavirus]